MIGQIGERMQVAVTCRLTLTSPRHTLDGGGKQVWQVGRRIRGSQRTQEESTDKMEVIEVIRTRRSVRQFTTEAIPDDVLGRLLEALRLAPTGGNQQPFKFVVVRDTEVKARLAAACHWKPGAPNGHAFIAAAPLVIVACGSDDTAISRFHQDGEVALAPGQYVPPNVERRPGEYLNCMQIDLAIAVDHLVLQATAEGLGTCWIAALHEGDVKELLSIPENVRVLVVVPVGYTEKWPEARPRKPLEEIVSFDKYA